VSGVPGAFPVGRGRARGAGHRIGPRRIKKRVQGKRLRRFFSIWRAPNHFGDATGDALISIMGLYVMDYWHGVFSDFGRCLDRMDEGYMLLKKNQRTTLNEKIVLDVDG
jgi:hypothetical protein